MKTFQCPFCNTKTNKFKLVKHIERYHDSELSTKYVNYTAYRLVYDIVNNKPGHGTCIICGDNTKWNEKRQKYNRLCGKPECIKAIREQYKKRMIKIYNKTTLLDDPKHQEKMLAHRKISGKYTWSDGTQFEYVGSYEKSFLEFLDKVLEYRSDEIISPGPILEYDHNGIKRHWITDCLILPYNLIVEIKDGGDNPNKKNMSITREKTLCKEKMITNQGVYNYIRLTNNDFSQLLAILAEMKMKMVDKDDSNTFRINEETELLEFTNKFNKKYTNFSSNILYKLGSMFESVEEFDRSMYQDQDIIEDNITEIVEYIDSIYNDLVDIDTDSYYEDSLDDCDVYVVCVIYPKFMHKDYEETFKKIADNIINDIENMFSDIDIITYWIDEEEPLKGKIIGIKRTF